MIIAEGHKWDSWTMAYYRPNVESANPMRATGSGKFIDEELIEYRIA